jgi:hypothetical protein
MMTDLYSGKCQDWVVEVEGEETQTAQPRACAIHTRDTASSSFSTSPIMLPTT